MCLQETWRTGVSTFELENCVIFNSGLDPNQVKSRRGEQGVAILLSKNAVTSWRSAGSIVHSDLGARIVAVRLIVKDSNSNNVGLFLISAYAPIGNADQNLWDSFIEKLEICISRKLPNDILVIGCDTNSSVGSSNHRYNYGTMRSVGPFSLPHRNRAGIRFNTYLEVNNLVAITTYFKKNTYTTWTHPRSKLPHQIDHIITQKNDFCRFIDTGAATPLIYNDHKAVMCKLRISAHLKKRPTPREKLAKLNHDYLKNEDSKTLFCTSVLNELPINHRANYDELARAMQKTAHKVLPKRDRPQPGWLKQNEIKLKALIEKRNTVLSLNISRPTRSSSQKLHQVRRELKSAVNAAKNKWIVATCHKLNESASRKGTKECWDTVRILKNGLQKPKASIERMMRKEDGTRCKSSEENAEVFREHFKKLYERIPVYDISVLDLLQQETALYGLDNLPTDEDILKAVNSLKNNAPGESGLSSQMFKAIIFNNATFDLLKCIIVDFWENESPPEQFEIGMLKILPKKGDLSLPGNYRGIMLLEVACKIKAKIVHARLVPIAENLDHEAQNGFRPGRGCSDAVFTVKIAMKKRREHCNETWIVFLDLVKAFDRVPRDLLWTVLERFGFPQKLIAILKSIHKNNKVKLTVGTATHVLRCIIGVKQGDILGPILFTIFAAIMITWRKIYDGPLCTFRSKKDFILTGRRPNVKGIDFSISDSEYADDAAILFDSRETLETFTPLLINHFEKFGMEVHVFHPDQPNKPSKTEVLFVSGPPSSYINHITLADRNLQPIDLGNNKLLPVVTKFSYLGSTLNTDCRDNEDVIFRIKKAGNAFGALRKCLFSNPNVALDAKRAVYEGLILSILLYGAESWCLTEKLLSLLRIFHNRCIRSMCRVTLKQCFKFRISNEQLQGRLNMRSIDIYITKKQLRWAGHVARMDFERVPRKMLSSWVCNTRPIGAIYVWSWFGNIDLKGQIRCK